MLYSPDTSDSLLPSLPGSQVVDPANATLLGSSIGDVSSISVILGAKADMLKRMGVRLQHLSAQDALLVLRHSFAIPKLLYNLRTYPCFLSLVLLEYDKLLKSIVGRITNIWFDVDDRIWDQATLPVKMRDWVSVVQCSLHRLPFWPWLLPPTTLSSTSFLLIFMALLCPTSRMLKPCGPKVMIVILLKG